MNKSVKFKSTTEQGADEEEEIINYGWLYSLVVFLVGIYTAVHLGYQYAVYAKLLHENDMWFSNIKVILGEQCTTFNWSIVSKLFFNFMLFFLASAAWDIISYRVWPVFLLLQTVSTCSNFIPRYVVNNIICSSKNAILKYCKRINWIDVDD